MKTIHVLTLGLLAGSLSARAQFNSGSTGAYGPLNVTSNTTLDLPADGIFHCTSIYDIGAYEFQSPQSAISYAWLQQYGLLADGSADMADPDGDRSNNYQEWRAGTDPTNVLSLLRLLAPLPLGSNLAVTWQSVPGRSYWLERSMDLGALPRFLLLATNVPAAPATNITSFTDTNAIPAGPLFYRVGVE